MQYQDWVDQGLPRDVTSFLSFMEEISALRRLSVNKNNNNNNNNNNMVTITITITTSIVITLKIGFIEDAACFTERQIEKAER